MGSQAGMDPMTTAAIGATAGLPGKWQNKRWFNPIAETAKGAFHGMTVGGVGDIVAGRAGLSGNEWDPATQSYKPWGPNFTRAGALVGGSGGAARGLGNFGVRTFSRPAPPPYVTPEGQFVPSGGVTRAPAFEALRNFGKGMTAFSSPSALVDDWIERAAGGTGSRMPQFSNIWSTRAGRGGMAAGVAGIGAATAKPMLESAGKAMTVGAGTEGLKQLRELGLTDPEGRLDLSIPVNRAVNKAMPGMINEKGQASPLNYLWNQVGEYVKYADPLLKALGMTPESMSTAEKLMVLIGGGVGIGGFLTGHPWVGALGTAAAAAGGLPQYFPQLQNQFPWQNAAPGGVVGSTAKSPAELANQSYTQMADQARQKALQEIQYMQQSGKAQNLNEWQLQQALQERTEQLIQQRMYEQNVKWHAAQEAAKAQAAAPPAAAPAAR
jgi:hypothetical protein